MSTTSSPPHHPATLSHYSIHHLASWAFILGGVGLWLGYLLILIFTQRPDGDSTALTLFEAQYGGQTVLGQALGLPLRVRESLWFNGAGALFAWGTLYFFLNSLTSPLEGAKRHRPLIPLFWLSLLIIWGGWAWNQTQGWQGELYLEPGVAKWLGVDQKPTIIFERFLLPPAPSGIGRTLRLRLLVDGQAYDIAEATPYKRGAWTLTPHWYGAMVKSKELVQPLFFGASGSSQGLLRDAGEVRVVVDVEALKVTTTPRLQEVELVHYAIINARFAPGDGLLKLGRLICIVVIAYSLSQVTLGIITRGMIILLWVIIPHY